MKIKKITLYLLTILLFIGAESYSASMNKISRIQAAGVVTLKASHQLSNTIINWKISFYTIDEISGVSASSPDTTRLSGDSVKVLLVKYSNKYTFYKIYIIENNLKDSAEVQVFNKGVREKYLWKNPFVPAKPIAVQLILPSKYSSSSKFILSLHGTDRNASDYAETWRSFANANNYIIAAPEFSEAGWTSDAYILGNMISGKNFTGPLNPQNTWSFFLAQQIHKELYKSSGLIDSTYTIWGHSAGGQFVHRMALFLPDNLVSTYIVANPGWYTLPDMNVVYPWGVQNNLLKLDASDLLSFTNKNLIIMRGTADTLRDSNLNIEPLSDAQGKNRFQRAGYFYNYGKSVNSNTKWKLIDVPNVGHDYQKMSAASGNFLLNTTGILERSEKISEDLLVSNYPNPFNTSTLINFTIPKEDFTEATIFNIMGERIATLLENNLPAGRHQILFNAEKLASGFYLCRILSGKHISITKILLLK